jgi:hypothetical protein
VGFDWSDWRGAYDKVREETGEVREALAAGDADHLETSWATCSSPR